MENETTEITVVESNETALYLITKAEIDTQIATAKAFPRSIKAFQDKAMSYATISQEVAASCAYALPRAGKNIEGPSVRLAEIVCSSYQNIRYGARVIANDGKTITAQGICHDLENNNCVTIEVKRRITDKNGRTYNDDMQVMAGNAACAIALRNAVFKVVPYAFVIPIYNKAKEVARGTAETLPARRTKAIEYFKGIGITEKQICEKLELKKIEDIDLDKLFILGGFKNAIETDGASAQEIFSPAAGEPTKENKEATADAMKDLERVKANTEIRKKITAIEKRIEGKPADSDEYLSGQHEIEELEKQIIKKDGK